MVSLPRDFRDQYDTRGETFFEVASFLQGHHGRQYTTAEIESEVDVNERRIQQITKELDEDGWLNRREGRMTIVWNTEKHNPAETAATDALFGLYRDLLDVIKTHAQTSTGVVAIIGLCFFVAAGALLFLGGLETVVSESALPSSVFLVLGFALFVAALAATLLAPIQAFLNRTVDRVMANRSS